MLLPACTEHWGEDVEKFTGDYRYHNGIGEFFNCKTAKTHYVFKSRADKKLTKQYLALNLSGNDDVYIKIRGYFKEVEQIEGVDPAMEFVPVKLLEMDASRGCELGGRVGN